MDGSIGRTDIRKIGEAYLFSVHAPAVAPHRLKGSFWHRLKGAIEARGQKITQQEVAQLFSVRQPTISGTWAKPGKGPEIALGARIAAHYHLDVHYLYTGQGSPNVAPPDPETQRLLTAWMRLRHTILAGKLQGYADTLLLSMDSGGAGDTPAEEPFLRRGAEPYSDSKPA